MITYVEYAWIIHQGPFKEKIAMGAGRIAIQANMCIGLFHLFLIFVFRIPIVFDSMNPNGWFYRLMDVLGFLNFSKIEFKSQDTFLKTYLVKYNSIVLTSIIIPLAALYLTICSQVRDDELR